MAASNAIRGVAARRRLGLGPELEDNEAVRDREEAQAEAKKQREREANGIEPTFKCWSCHASSYGVLKSTEGNILRCSKCGRINII